MKINEKTGTDRMFGLSSQILRIMKLTILVMTVFLLQVSASTKAQITLNVKQESLRKVLEEISIQTSYDFIYSVQDFNKATPVDLKLNNVTIEAALKACFYNQPLVYTIEDKTVMVKAKQATILRYTTSSSQIIPVHGKVVDAISEKPLSGATIKLKGSNESLKTDAQGEFRIYADEKAVLIISFIGYKTKEIAVAKEMGKILMENGSSELEEVAVTLNTGYQKIRQEQSTGAIDQITTKKYESAINTDFLAGLQGRMTGLLINNDIQFTGGDGKTNNLFQIRGLSTISGNSSPLIVLDGYPTNLSLKNINPNEIQSVTILKDAAAAAIYGARASNGVVVVESKMASLGKPSINFRTTVTYTPQENYSRYRWAPSNTNLNYQRYVDGDGDLVDPNLAALYGPAMFEPAAQIPGKSLMVLKAQGKITKDQYNQAIDQLGAYNNIDDYQRLFTRVASTQSYNLDFSGGNPNALYYITAAYKKGTANQIENSNQAFQLNARVNLTFSKRLSLELITAYNQQISNTSPVPGISSLYPTDRLQDEYGNSLAVYTGGATQNTLNSLLTMGLYDPYYYPLIDVHEIKNEQTNIDNRFTARFKYNIGNGLSFSLGGSYERSNGVTTNYATDAASTTRRLIDYYARPNANKVLTFYIPKGAQLQTYDQDVTGYTVRSQLDYSKRLGKHLITAIVGAEVNRTTNSSRKDILYGYNDQTLLHQPVDWALISSSAFLTGSAYANASPVSYSNAFPRTYADDRYVSGYANAAYTFKSRYSLTASVRVDQSNLFGTDPRFRYKPMWSFGAGWDISKEPFMEKISWVHTLKLRLADGITGNTAKMVIPQVIAQAGIITGSLDPLAGTPYLYLGSPANGGLRWESTNNFNVGLDWSIFKGINGSIDYYNKQSRDVLGQSLIDPTTGVANATVNQASLSNTGVEIKVDADWIKGQKINWYTGFVLSKNTSKVLALYNGPNRYPNSSQWVTRPMNYAADYPIGAFFSYRFAGLDAVGAPLIYDSKGQAIQPKNAGLAADEVVYSGTQIPAYTVGISNRLDIGRFYVYCMLNYYAGFSVRVPTPTLSAPRPIAGAENFWKQPGDEKNTIIMNPNLGKYMNSIESAVNNAYTYGDNWVVRGNYITVSNLTFSYDFGDMAFLKKAGLKSLQLLLQGSNLYTKGFNRFNYSQATGSFEKSYLTPTYTVGVYTNF